MELGSSLKLLLSNIFPTEEKNTCPRCNGPYTDKIAVLLPCQHLVCHSCLDILYDYYLLRDIEAMFECPICGSVVIDWESKNIQDGKICDKVYIKTIEMTDNPAKFKAILLQQHMLRLSLVLLDHPAEGNPFETKNRPLFIPNDLSTNITSESEKILTKMPFTDLIKANQECISRDKTLSFRITTEKLWDLDDSMSIDEYFVNFSTGQFINNGYTYRIIMVLRNGLYLGHVWYFTKPDMPDFCGIYGIKSSIVNLIAKQSMGDLCPSYRKGTSYRILKEVENIAKSENRRRIIVPWPLETMRYVLTKIGYTEINTNDNIPERRFLAGLTPTSNLYVKNIH